jgi:hypothetical protein
MQLRAADMPVDDVRSEVPKQTPKFYHRAKAWLARASGQDG